MKVVWTGLTAFFKKSNRILRHELSPDDWCLIWPELAEPEQSAVREAANATVVA